PLKSAHQIQVSVLVGTLAYAGCFNLESLNQTLKERTSPARASAALPREQHQKRHEHQPAPVNGFEVGIRARDGNLVLVSTPSNATTAFRLHQLLAGLDIFQVVVFTSDMLTAKGTSCKRIKGVRGHHWLIYFVCRHTQAPAALDGQNGP
ncbi:hypothetical protein CPB97_004749, partial [Podila verticillata]